MEERLTRTTRSYLAAGMLLYAILIAPPVLRFLETWMTSHMTVLVPGLAVAGWHCGAGLRTIAAPVNRAWNAGGIPGLVTAVFAGMFWMLPRALDESLVNVSTEITKVVTIPLFVGLPLALSWQPLGPIWRGVLKANLISMFVALGWLYSAAPVRLCSSYLQSDQALLGQAFLVLAGALAVAWSFPWFFGCRNAVASAYLDS